MKILWITHDPIRSSVNDGASSSGFWKEALIQLLKSVPGTEIYVCFPGVKKERITTHFFSFRYNNQATFNKLPPPTIADLKWVLNEVNPDLIHIHGTEVPYGLLSEHTTIPVVISLQGFLSESYNAVLGNIALPIWKKEKTVKERILRNSFIDMHNNWYNNSFYEIEIIKKNKYFIGRTTFDKDFVLKHNATATYYTGHELLRQEFYNNTWKLSSVDRYSIYTSSHTNPLKGFHILLEAVVRLVLEFPGIKVRVPGGITGKQVSKWTGNSYSRILKKIIEENNLTDRIEFCGKLNGEQIARLLKHSHVFVLPSFIENSSNALGEAQLTGVPCVVTDGGGTPSIVKEKENGLYFRKGDGFDLANKIRDLFLNDTLTEHLSKESRTTAAAFHDPAIISNQYISIYKTILTNESSV